MERLPASRNTSESCGESRIPDAIKLARQYVENHKLRELDNNLLCCRAQFPSVSLKSSPLLRSRGHKDIVYERTNLSYKTVLSVGEQLCND